MDNEDDALRRYVDCIFNLLLRHVENSIELRHELHVTRFNEAEKRVELALKSLERTKDSQHFDLRLVVSVAAIFIAVMALFVKH